MMQTLLLDLTDWDLVLDVTGGLAVASEPYSTAQDVCSAVRTFLGECWYNTTLGVDYYGTALDNPNANLALLKDQIVTQAARVPDCVGPVVYFQSLTARVLTGQVQFTEGSTGQGMVAGFGNSPFVLNVSTLGSGAVLG